MKQSNGRISCLSRIGNTKPEYREREREAKQITDEGEVIEYLGVKVEKLRDNRIKMSQPYLIDQILHGLGVRLKNKSQENSSSIK